MTSGTALEENFVAFNEGAYRNLAHRQLGEIFDTDRLPGGAIESLMQQADLAALAPHQMLELRDDPCRGLHLIVEGAVAAGMHLATDSPTLVSLMGPGDLASVVSHIDRQPCLADLQAFGPAIVLTIPMASIQAAADRFIAIRDALERQLAHRARILFDRTVELMRLPLGERLAHKLDFLATRFGVTRERGLVISLRLSQEDIARLLGASRQQVNVELKRMERLGQILVARESITVLDHASLRAGGYAAMPPTLARHGPVVQQA